MTTLQQALHIFRKDVRHLRLEIGAVLLMILVFVLSGVETWEDLQERGGPDNGETPLLVLLPLVWGLLIARLIQTEALPGDRHFWLTRPYSRVGLVVGKLLFIAAFVNLPFLVAQAAIVALDGLPLFSSLGGLFWNQVVLTIILVVPVTAIATLTRNLAQFLPAAVLGVAVMVGIVEAMDGRMRDLVWVPVSMALMLATAIGGFVVWRQYRLRRSGNTALIAFGAAFASLILCASFPDQAAFAIQSSLIGGPDKQFALQLGAPEPKVAAKGPARTPNKYWQTVRLPITVSGTEAKNLMVQSWDLSFKTLSGMTRHGRTKIDFTPSGLVQLVNVDREFFNTAKNSPVTLRVVYSLTQFGNVGSADVPLDGTPVFVPGLGQCGAAARWDHREFYCRAPFQSPGMFSSDRVGEVVPWMEAYRPFPWQARVQPVISRGYELAEGLAKELAPSAPEKPLTLTVRERVAYFRYTLEAPNVRLADYAVDDSDEDEQ